MAKSPTTAPVAPTPPKVVDDVLGSDPAADQIGTEYPMTVNASMVASQVGAAAVAAANVLRARGLPADVVSIQRSDLIERANLRRRALARLAVRQMWAEADDLERQARTPRPEVRGQGARAELRTDVARSQLVAAQCGSNAEELVAAYSFTRLCLDDIGQTVLFNWATDIGQGDVIEPLWRVDHPVPASQLDRARSLRQSAVELLANLDDHHAFGALT